MYQLPLTDHEERLSVSTKCSNCTDVKTKVDPVSGDVIKAKPVITDQVALVITPFSEDVDPMESLKLSKRLVLCTVCGNLRLIN